MYSTSLRRLADIFAYFTVALAFVYVPGCPIADMIGNVNGGDTEPPSEQALDSSADGSHDDIDGCPNNPGKTVPGQCGCKSPETDSDDDGTADCNDGCPTDPNKLSPGVCGCGQVDTDTDGDDIPDCNDQCPGGDDNTDADGDGTADFCDRCSNDDPDDTDGDGVCDSADNCPNDANPAQEDRDNDGIGDLCEDVNDAPTADAGTDLIVHDQDRTGAEGVVLDGGGSFDADGNIVAYEWFERGVVIGRGETLTITLATGVHTIILTVTDDNSATSSDEVVVCVNEPPTANAGLDQTLYDWDGGGHELVTPDWIGSFDNDGFIVTCEWEFFIDRPRVLPCVSRGGIPGLRMLALPLGSHPFKLTVTDDKGASDSDDVVFNVLRGL